VKSLDSKFDSTEKHVSYISLYLSLKSIDILLGVLTPRSSDSPTTKRRKKKKREKKKKKEKR
jgi:hypothetical protein